jgi:putrescine aminotransferase
MTSEHFRRGYNKHLLHPWANFNELGKDENKTVITRGEGIYIYDADGNRLLDGPAGMWCMQLGYGRPEIAEAVSKQMNQLAYTSSWNVVNDKEIELASRIASKTPGDLNRIFFTTCGSTAVDAALRLCQLASNIKGQPNRKHILSRESAYHGSSFLAASVTGKERDKSAMDVLIDKVHFISEPCFYHHPSFASEEEFCDFLIDELEDKINELGAENIMCFIAEPILASGGVIVPPKDYNYRCWEKVKKYGITYIADEIVTGFGRLGHWFVSEEVMGIVPDIITFAKGITAGHIPLGGYAVSEKFLQELSDDKEGFMYANGFTWSGNPVACAAALASWDIFEKEDVFSHVKEISTYFQQQLKTLEQIPLVGEVRGVGLMAAVEASMQVSNGNDRLEKDYAVGELVDSHCQQLGLLVRPLINLCIISPPLVIIEAQVDELVSILKKGLELTLADLREQGIWQDTELSHNTSNAKRALSS